ncbi:MAG: hypothetical protein EOR11_12400 [Mesorhizobium sp.]|nr:MAG: hypothetical protein EOR11_12400 [Mesorhizobium sp.]
MRPGVFCAVRAFSGVDWRSFPKQLPTYLCLVAIPKGKRCALFPGKPPYTFPGIAPVSVAAATTSTRRRGRLADQHGEQAKRRKQHRQHEEHIHE